MRSWSSACLRGRAASPLKGSAIGRLPRAAITIVARMLSGELRMKTCLKILGKALHFITKRRGAYGTVCSTPCFPGRGRSLAQRCLVIILSGFRPSSYDTRSLWSDGAVAKCMILSPTLPQLVRASPRGGRGVMCDIPRRVGGEGVGEDHNSDPGRIVARRRERDA